MHWNYLGRGTELIATHPFSLAFFIYAVADPARNLDWSWQSYIVCTSERPRIPYLRRLWATMPRTRYYTIHLDYCLGPYFSKLPICNSRLLTVGNVYQLKSRNLFFVSITISPNMQRHRSVMCVPTFHIYAVSCPRATFSLLKPSDYPLPTFLEPVWDPLQTL